MAARGVGVGEFLAIDELLSERCVLTAPFGRPVHGPPALFDQLLLEDVGLGLDAVVHGVVGPDVQCVDVEILPGIPIGPDKFTDLSAEFLVLR